MANLPPDAIASSSDDGRGSGDPWQLRELRDMVEKVKADIAEQEGDTWENLDKKYGFEITCELVLDDSQQAGKVVGAEEARRKVMTHNSSSNIPLDAPALKFKYDRLPVGYIRLLAIRGLGDFPLVDLQIFPMHATPEYKAISHAWEKGRHSRIVFCNGRAMPVSTHLLDGINHLGLGWMDEWIWIDSICINQADDVEKATQVADMHRIYRQAARVVVWLGAADDDSELVMSNMDQLYNWGMTVASVGIVPGQAENELFEPPPVDLCQAVGRFVARPWFHRVWVVQEFVLAKDVVLVCGDRFVEWNTFCVAVLLLRDNHLAHLMADDHGAPAPMVAVALANLDELHRLSQNRQTRMSIVDFVKLLKMGRFRKVTEPVDRVWGFLGLANEELRAAARPYIDYSPDRKHDYYKTYADMAKLLLQRDPELYLLAIVPSASRPPGMPSWCPNFHAAGLNGVSIQSRANLAFSAGYLKGTEGKPTIEFGPEPYTLRLQGYRLDTVTKVITVRFRLSSSWEEERIRATPRDDLAHWEQQCLDLARATIPRRRGPFLDAHWKTLCFDQMAEHPAKAVRGAYFNFRHWANQNEMAHPRNLSVEDRKLVAIFKSHVHLSCSRAYFSTAGGRVGLGTRNMAAGDLVCVVRGSKVPYILRPRPGEAELEFVGDAYVDGVMYGESLSEGRTFEEFRIT